jgi:hypothetical protein
MNQLKAIIMVVACSVAGLVPATLFMSTPVANAASLSSRKMEISTSKSGAVANVEFTFDYPALLNVGSVQFEYCDNPLFNIACVAPLGIDASIASLVAQSGELGFSLFATTANKLVITRSPTTTSTTTSSYKFSSVTNPSSPIEFFVKMSAYPTFDASGPYSDFGSVVSHTTSDLSISTIVPPILEFCAAITIPLNSCSSAQDSLVQLGELNSSNTSVGTSQILAATNANFGYVMRVYGKTLTSGNNTIQAMNSLGSSSRGQSQFGINLRQNNSPSVGSSLVGVGVASPVSDYNTLNKFKYLDGDKIASSTTVSDYVRYTVSYIANVPQSQRPGVYNTTLTYVISATF